MGKVCPEKSLQLERLEKQINFLRFMRKIGTVQVFLSVESLYFASYLYTLLISLQPGKLRQQVIKFYLIILYSSFRNKYRPKCSRCRKAKPEELANNFVVDPALAAVQQGMEIKWQEVVDPASYQMYVLSDIFVCQNLPRIFNYFFFIIVITTTKRQEKRSGSVH